MFVSTLDNLSINRFYSTWDKIVFRPIPCRGRQTSHGIRWDNPRHGEPCLRLLRSHYDWKTIVLLVWIHTMYSDLINHFTKNLHSLYIFIRLWKNITFRAISLSSIDKKKIQTWEFKAYARQIFYHYVPCFFIFLSIT